jgi:CheY-like chemotaxis protein/anti-sigma regulatory factor (Ser/Thr protein kinase)
MRIINDLLDFSKIEAGRMQMEERAFSLREIIDEVVAINRPRIEGKGLALELRVTEDLPDWVHGDSLRLRQILLNLLDNAAKFTEKGRIELTVDFDRDDRAYRFQVSDTGIGISPAALAHIFDAFSQADANISRQFGGTGLGLAICKQLSHLMGGTLTVESAVNRGSRFELRVPLRQARPPQAALEPPAEAAVPDFRRGRILVAEDNPVNQKLVQYLLENLGFTVTVVGDGRQACEAAKSGAFELALMDCQMPECDGLEASRLIRRWESEQDRGHLPIIALTANAMPGFKEVCTEAGMDSYLTKPIEERRCWPAWRNGCRQTRTPRRTSRSPSHRRRPARRHSTSTASSGSAKAIPNTSARCSNCSSTAPGNCWVAWPQPSPPRMPARPSGRRIRSKGPAPRLAPRR